MKKRHVFPFVLLLIFPFFISPFTVIVSATVSEDWGVEEGDVKYFTAGYENNLTMSDSIWQILNDKLIEQLNNTDSLPEIPGDETVDLKNLFLELKEIVPNVVNFEMNITDVYDTVSFLPNTEYDNINGTVKAKIAGEDDYETLETFASELCQNGSDWLDSSEYFPETLGDHLSGYIDSILPFNEGLFGEIQLTNWVTETNDDTPQYLVSLGKTSDSELMSTSPFFIPQDLDFTEVYMEMLGTEELNGMGILVDIILNNYIEEVGISEFEIREKEIYVEFDLSDLNGLFATILGLSELGSYIYEELSLLELLLLGIYIYEEMPFLSPVFNFIFLMEGLGLNISTESIAATAIMGMKWDEYGVLDNLHCEVSLNCSNTTDNDLISMDLILDISQGEWNEIGHQFTGAPSTVTTTPELTEAWGIGIGDKVEYTIGYELDIDLPDELWDFMDEGLWELINLTFTKMGLGGYPIGEIFNAEAIYNSIINDIPTIYNIEAEVTGIGSYDLVIPGNGSEDVYLALDMIFTELRGKVPDDLEYQLLESLGSDILANNFSDFFNSLPETLENDLTDFFGNITSIPENIIPAIPQIWITDFNSSEVPSFLVDAGIAILPNSTSPIGGGGLFIPTNTDYSEIFNQALVALTTEIDNSSSTPEMLFDQMGLSILVEKKEIFVGFNYADMSEEYQALIKTQLTTQILTGLASYVELDLSTLSCNASLSAKWNESTGILMNSHAELSFSVSTISGDPISISYLYDISQGEYEEIGVRFMGEPYELSYEGEELKPSNMSANTVVDGEDQEISLTSEELDIEINIVLNTTGPVTVVSQVWDENPTEASPNLGDNDAAIYFSIDVNNPENIEFPIYVTVNLPENTPENLNESEIAKILKIMTWDEIQNNWVEQNFELVVNPDGTVTIVIDHLSVFAMGISDSGFQIPGYPTEIFGITVLLGICTLILKNRKLQHN
ncbi:MAG: hypothetical protein ACTSWY_14665 [Promethearchaeota archaeon]